MLSKKLLNILTLFYIAFLVVGFFYVRSVVATERIKVEETPEEEDVEEIKPLTVFLQVESPTGTVSYKANMTTANTLEDFFEELRKNQQFQYEKNYYTDGPKLFEVNNKRSEESYDWLIFENNIDITNKLEDLKLKDNAQYKIVFTRI